MLLHMYVIFTSRYCFLSKCAQYDTSCRRALKHYSFIHCLPGTFAWYEMSISGPSYSIVTNETEEDVITLGVTEVMFYSYCDISKPIPKLFYDKKQFNLKNIQGKEETVDYQQFLIFCWFL